MNREELLQAAAEILRVWQDEIPEAAAWLRAYDDLHTIESMSQLLQQWIVEAAFVAPTTPPPAATDAEAKLVDRLVTVNREPWYDLTEDGYRIAGKIRNEYGNRQIG